LNLSLDRGTTFTLQRWPHPLFQSTVLHHRSTTGLSQPEDSLNFSSLRGSEGGSEFIDDFLQFYDLQQQHQATGNTITAADFIGENEEEKLLLLGGFTEKAFEDSSGIGGEGGRASPGEIGDQDLFNSFTAIPTNDGDLASGFPLYPTNDINCLDTLDPMQALLNSTSSSIYDSPVEDSSTTTTSTPSFNNNNFNNHTPISPPTLQHLSTRSFSSGYRVSKFKPSKPSISITTSQSKPLKTKVSKRTEEYQDGEEVLEDKRQRNNIAAKKYRQKKVDRITELEAALEEMRKERDELQLKLARQEAETKVLREMMKGPS